jgi:hypothetical protein
MPGGQCQIVAAGNLAGLNAANLNLANLNAAGRISVGQFSTSRTGRDRFQRARAWGGNLRQWDDRGAGDRLRQIAFSEETRGGE